MLMKQVTIKTHSERADLCQSAIGISCQNFLRQLIFCPIAKFGEAKVVGFEDFSVQQI